MKCIIAAALFTAAIVMAENDFKMVKPGSRGFNDDSDKVGPCGGFNDEMDPIKIKAKQEFKFGVPKSKGFVGLFYLSEGNDVKEWKPLLNITSDGGHDEVEGEVEFKDIAKTNTKGTVAAHWYYEEGSDNNAVYYQCVDVAHGDDLKNSATIVQATFMTLAVTTVTLLARL
ncbi:hypothetical protein BJ085DRAFT_32548 [Dimargaris cristalligena]|uniref:Copper acquisition factor BIM1-like domain-containing protein n=1 Tax=Dimargaris cristalligena TaxID=215637 RepID=A0A4P9ZPX7_9FUNG|nr:hypothetical protein BJ085DRAFT_32548 [Dimargaris cristalligena]|eukprot:RKP34761.1 hypothetical protein BJ085DRAFT_32548 [Dimargaris cristalligena]